MIKKITFSIISCLLWITTGVTQTLDFPIIPLEKNDLQNFLKKEATHMHPDVIQKVISILHCRKNSTPFVTVIDFSLPSNKKRLWVLDMRDQKLLFHTHLAHGIYSGERYTQFFSNAHRSRQSSMGVYITLSAYKGREGTSLKLKGLEDGYNDQAEGRAIVMHGGHYAEEEFVNKYGRTGRSWGCPAIPASKAKEIIDTIKDNNLVIAYYPNERWLLKSKFLNCYNYTLKPAKHVLVKNVERPQNYHEIRDDVLFASELKQQFKTENPPILCMKADVYQQIFQKKPPLSRMLRRDIQGSDYLAISPAELSLISNEKYFSNLHFIIPTITQSNGHAKTLMKIVDLGQITNIDSTNLIIHTTQQPITLQPNRQFIRWLGL